MAGKNFTTEPRNVVAIPFEINGEAYEFWPPKSSAFAMAVIKVNPDAPGAEERKTRAMLIWFGRGLDADHESTPGNPTGHYEFVEGCQACKVEAKLHDPDDELDLDTLVKIMNYCFEEVTGRPPTPTPGSSRQRGNGRPSLTAGLPPEV